MKNETLAEGIGRRDHRMKLKYLKWANDTALSLMCVSIGFFAWAGGSSWIWLVIASAVYAAIVIIRDRPKSKVE